MTRDDIVNNILVQSLHISQRLRHEQKTFNLYKV